MTRYPIQRRAPREVARVASFHDDRARFTRARRGSFGCHVRVTHASVGSTDVMARRGDYLLHPLPGFISGYDFVGVLETADATANKHGLTPGQRVVGILPNMGTHASWLNAPASLLVPVPEEVSSEVAATLPLDGVTAMHALDLLSADSSSVFISGVSGAVGLLATQLAVRRGMRVVGTGSSASAAAAKRYGARVIDYRDERWPDRLRETVGSVDGVIDHTGSAEVRKIVAANGRLVRTAFGGPPGQQKKATAIGFARTLLRRYADPSEVLCSAPMYVAFKRSSYRDDLSVVLDLVARRQLVPPEPVLHDKEQFPGALEAARQQRAGTKVVLKF